MPDGRRISALMSTVPFTNHPSRNRGSWKYNGLITGARWSLFGLGAEFFRVSNRLKLLLLPGGVGRYTSFSGWEHLLEPAGLGEVTGAIRGKYSSLGWEQVSWWGFHWLMRGHLPRWVRSEYNHVPRGSIYWSPKYGSDFESFMDWFDPHWVFLRMERVFLGYPISDELT